MTDDTTRSDSLPNPETPASAAIVRVELGKEINNRSRWPWTVPQYGLSGISHQPLLDACRKILDAGHDGEQMAGMFRQGKARPDLITRTIREAAALTVSEPDKGTIRFAKYKPWVDAPPIESPEPD